MQRKIRGLEDSETNERKSLHRDVRTPWQLVVNALRDGNVQTGGIMGAGLCLFCFPAFTSPLFCIGVIMFILRCVFAARERLPFRMPLGCGCRDKGESAFRPIEERYEALKKRVAETVLDAPSAMLNTPYGDSWFMPSTESYVARMVKDAGGDYIYKRTRAMPRCP